MSNNNGKPPQVFLVAVLSSLKKASLGIGTTSAIINLLALTGSFFMLQVYDRVVPGRSLENWPRTKQQPVSP